MKCYGIYASDCDVLFYEGAPEELFCTGCGSYICEEQYLPKSLNIKKQSKNFSFTYDNRLLLSKDARDFFIENSQTELSFHIVNRNPDLYIMDTVHLVAFDAVKRQTRFDEYCELCGNYESVVGVTPIFLKDANTFEPYSVAKTDVKFGTSREKSPIYIVGEELAAGLKKKFKEIDLVEVSL